MPNHDCTIIMLASQNLLEVETLLQYLAPFRNVHSKLHVFSDAHDAAILAPDEDVLILELKMPVRTTINFLEYVSTEHPGVKALVFSQEPIYTKTLSKNLKIVTDAEETIVKNQRSSLN